MKHRILVVLAAFTLILAVGCSTAIAQTAPPNTETTLTSPTASSGFVADEFNRVVAFTRADIQNALDGANAGHDTIGAACHQRGLAQLDKLTSATPVFVSVNKTGVASIAEDIRLKEMALDQARVAFAEQRIELHALRDQCAAVFPVAQVFAPLMKVLGILGL